MQVKKSAKQLRYESRKDWDRAKVLEHEAKDALNTGDKDRFHDLEKAAEEIKDKSVEEWDDSKTAD